ncbi:hypothetical protein NPX13_g7422 [Xylaria arbuscula]|uniref:AB hydrolase-1 domain-containing protein n=1 Tax=Xylaria arbuscula TaxID=114810 RepID=A0A9W8NAD4_9PEZI|nr:hypothetical protein NPX13_g7422 [Xylaria arbuscula]
MFQFPLSDFCFFEFLRVLGTAPTHGCDVGECFEVIQKIRHNDGESWYEGWSEAAEKAEVVAKSAAARGDAVAARWAYLRASNYWRSSELMLRSALHLQGTRQYDIISRAVTNFRKACSFMDTPVEFIEIPFGTEGATLPAYLFLPSKGPDGQADGKIPIAVQVQGFDTIQEEFYHFTVAGALPRGYAVLTFDAPGQGIVARRPEHRLFLQSDFETVVKAVLDALWAHTASSPSCKKLDLNRVALLGNSMGAYFALRGAAHDQRISACIASDGFYDLGAAARERIPWWFKFLSRGIVENLMSLAVRLSNFQTRWELSHGVFAFGVSSVSGVMEKSQDFTLDKPDGSSFLADITCPTLVTHAEDSVFRLDSDRIYSSLSKLREGESKLMWNPTTIGEGSLQAKVAAFSHLHSFFFEWLDDVFDIVRPSLNKL